MSEGPAAAGRQQRQRVPWVRGFIVFQNAGKEAKRGHD